MGKRINVGDKLPFFRYDTPYSKQNRFRPLLAAQAPLVLVFMGNFGHPVTRTYALKYARTYGRLKTGGCALVVRSRADKLARGIRENSLPYELLCDAEGVLYEHLDIPRRSGVTAYSIEAWQIMHEARRKGYSAPKNAEQQLPLTLVLAADGTVLFSHYGTTLTDMPADCGAMQAILDELALPADDADDDDVTVYAGKGHAAPDIPALAALDRSVKEYGAPELDKTLVGGIFDDPYRDD